MRSKLTTPNIIACGYPSIMTIRIDGEPIEYERPQLPSQHADKLFQNLMMMHFQQQVMHVASAKLRSAKLAVFQKSVSVEIKVVTLSAIQDIRLEYAIKSILDGLNKAVIRDDTSVMNIQIWLEKVSKSYDKPYTRVTITDNVTRASITFKIDGPIVEKVLAIPYNIGGSLNYSKQFLNELSTIENEMSSLRGSFNNSYEICHICFYTNNLRKDVDNMFLTYIYLLRVNGYIDASNTVGFGMYKRAAISGEEKTLISLVPK
ncbi:hypothetical protein [Lysinibacillus xylanilyticus]|uniref:hypothetical protein n=1 Tax=Lysinibacillus xylanilyticus TaxID=582475 RepID=UPI003D07894E